MDDCVIVRFVQENRGGTVDVENPSILSWMTTNMTMDDLRDSILDERNYLMRFYHINAKQD